ncbi:carboxypeptidase-like regulatory domain-containing protein [Pontibacter sp. 172403-2]|uniref:TonB-dependent receptor n=1 Tax=Pontibacter rufus TaxID=2791028 RepID=UPI0018AF9C55|nr:TonB-dependent receptor [Pontibacter sp. 172403-2]MBF9251776.1 carboxypeptidase-like regulatory domain-containing protein [Pontibacter sp. 172403-2]
MKFLFTLLPIILTTAVSVLAQPGTLKGKITDKNSGEGIIGAVVFIRGTSNGTTTDYEGNYMLPLAPGTYTVSVTFVSYKSSENAGVIITGGQTTTLDVPLAENTTELQAVEIVGARHTNTDLALMQSMRASEVVVSGMAAEQIAKSMDRDAAAVVRRIPGVTVMNDKYIVIRGMNQRYNTVLLNDALAPSTEPDTKAFSFDVLPTSVIDRIMIYKNGSPELPGEFGGGIIKIYTKSMVDENSTSVSLSGSYRAGTTFRNGFLTSQGGKTDFIGFDNGGRSLPAGFPARVNASSTPDGSENPGHKLPNTWAPGSIRALPDLRFLLGLNRRFDVGGVRLSNISAASYTRTTTYTEGSRDSYGAYRPETGAKPEYKFQDKIYTQSARIGLVHNWTARLNNNNKLEFRNLFNQMGSSEVLMRSGEDYENGEDVKNYALRYESRTIYTSQLQGTHDLNDGNTTLTWTGGYAYSNRNEPDYRRFRTTRSLGSEEPFILTYKNTPSLNDAGRYYAKLNENSFTLNGQAEHRFSTADAAAENTPKIRAGFYAECKNRDFSARFFSYRPANTEKFDNSLLTLPFDQVFVPENINATTGWELVEDYNPQNNYKAYNTLLAVYVGGVLPLTPKLSASGGLRVEHNNQELQATNFDGTALSRSNSVLSVLPSANFTYALNKRSMLRAGASISVNRPEFRELAPFMYYDFVNLLEVSGNPDLQTATIFNTDLRYEFYPNPTEILSLGVFYKYFSKPIETVFENTSGGNSITSENAQYATSYGVEAEVKKSLLNLSESKFVQNLSLVLNAALIDSQVKLSDRDAASQDQNRVMQGQSPYVVNTGVYYQDDNAKLQFSLLYNVVGQRIFAVGNNLRQTVYELPKNVIDLSVTKGFGNFELKAGVQDILNQQTRLMLDLDRDGKITEVDKSFRRFRQGQYSTLGLTYTF